MRTIIIFSISLMFCSCNTNQQQNIAEIKSQKVIDGIDIIYYNNHKYDTLIHDTLIYKEQDVAEINILTKLLTNTNTEFKDTCQPAGKLIYKYSDNSNVELEFSSIRTNEIAECSFVKHKIGNKSFFNPLPKDAETLIDNVLWGRLKWSSIKMDTSTMILYKDTVEK